MTSTTQNEPNKLRNRALIALLGAAVIAAASFLAPFTGRQVPTTSMLGAFASILLIFLFLWRFPFRLYVCTIVFTLLANAFGSILGFYHLFAYYDKFVHGVSGILLAEVGYVFFERVQRGLRLSPNWRLTILFALFFSIACAGLWEVYEFTADSLLSLQMQGGNTDTVTDIIAGSAGAVLYAAVFWPIKRKETAKRG